MVCRAIGPPALPAHPEATRPCPPASIDESQVRELAGLAFKAEASNMLLLNPPSVGMTYLAAALALGAILRGQGYTSSVRVTLSEDIRMPI